MPHPARRAWGNRAYEHSVTRGAWTTFRDVFFSSDAFQHLGMYVTFFLLILCVLVVSMCVLLCMISRALSAFD